MPAVTVDLADSQVIYTCLVMLQEIAFDCDELMMTHDLHPLDSMSEDQQHSHQTPSLYLSSLVSSVFFLLYLLRDLVQPCQYLSDAKVSSLETGSHEI